MVPGPDGRGRRAVPTVTAGVSETTPAVTVVGSARAAGRALWPPVGPRGAGRALWPPVGPCGPLIHTLGAVVHPGAAGQVPVAPERRIAYARIRRM